jgi:hypothetical protein
VIPGVDTHLPGGVGEPVRYFAPGETEPRAAIVTSSYGGAMRSLLVFGRHEDDHYQGYHTYPIPMRPLDGLGGPEGWLPLGAA